MQTPETLQPPYDLMGEDMQRAPQRLWHQLASECPVHFAPQLHGFVLSSWADCAALLRDPELSTGLMTAALDMRPPEEAAAIEWLRKTVRLWMGHTVPEDHTRLRRLLQGYFTPKTVRTLEPVATAIADELLDAAEQAGRFELVDDFAYPLPARVIAHMLGVPTQDHEAIQRWSADITKVFTSVAFEDILTAQRSMQEMIDYMVPIVEEHRGNPQEDVISAFIEAEVEHRVSVEEILSNCVLLLFAGHETTANLIANGTVALFEHPEQLARLRAEPELMANAIEEMLRWEGPATLTMRINGGEPRVIAGVEIPAHAMIVAGLGCANMDPREFEDPLRFDVAREKPKTLTFGMGGFYCLGAALARMEGRVAFSRMLERFPELAPVGAPEWSLTSPLNRQLQRYELRVR
ncbi:cytochrome P450 [Pseudenhygromyxa sp. WMMC2535]|uniref:cytochrome P450 n=1 Tax=Pseudenhygromyxa sp. WMMC2535 TaxID=2712867 RepID=UPI001551B443|nr:cytochrome P450 [Pseudenhygromyxa sp. WMMC2535]NVB39209.1 cytochrome P450 [Pseudenhygromyxa sp. WMMC2535]